jgi:uncharacterized membrane protein
MKNEILSWVLAITCVALCITIIILIATFYYVGVFILVLIAIWITKRVIENEFFND